MNTLILPKCLSEVFKSLNVSVFDYFFQSLNPKICTRDFCFYYYSSLFYDTKLQLSRAITFTKLKKIVSLDASQCVTVHYHLRIVTEPE